MTSLFIIELIYWNRPDGFKNFYRELRLHSVLLQLEDGPLGDLDGSHWQRAGSRDYCLVDQLGDKADSEIVPGRIGARQGRHFLGRWQRIFTVQQREKEIAEKEEAGVLFQSQRTGRDDETDEVKIISSHLYFIWTNLIHISLLHLYLYGLT